MMDVYGTIKFGFARFVLFLVDRNSLGKQLSKNSAKQTEYTSTGDRKDSGAKKCNS